MSAGPIKDLLYLGVVSTEMVWWGGGWALHKEGEIHTCIRKIFLIHTNSRNLYDTDLGMIIFGCVLFLDHMQIHMDTEFNINFNYFMRVQRFMHS